MATSDRPRDRPKMLFVPLYLVHTSLTEEALLDDDGRDEGDDVGGDHEADADRGSLTHSLPEARPSR